MPGNLRAANRLQRRYGGGMGEEAVVRRTTACRKAPTSGGVVQPADGRRGRDASRACEAQSELEGVEERNARVAVGADAPGARY